MPEQYRITSTSQYSVEVEKLNAKDQYEKNIEIESTPSFTTRKAIRAKIVRKSHVRELKAEVTLLHQRKSAHGVWEDLSQIQLSKLKGGEGVRLELSSTATFNLYQELKNIYELAASGEVMGGSHELVVGKAGEIVKVEDPDRAAAINKLISEGHSKEVWDSLNTNNPDLAAKFSLAKIQQDRLTVLKEFENKMNEDTSELDWQHFFEKNKWIFGYGLRYVFLDPVTSQPNFGGTDVTGDGGQRGDFLEHTLANNSFTVLVEIKKHNTAIVLDKNNRSGCDKLTHDLLDAVNQIQVNCHTWNTQGADARVNRPILDDKGIYTIEPKGILVIGHTSQLSDINKRQAFETFRSNLNKPEVITFDELFNRAKYIIGEEIKK